jgi:hypothetical protein
MTKRLYRTGYQDEVPIEKIVSHGHKTTAINVERIEQSMRNGGWQGRPLLVIDMGIEGKVKALTGSHRLEAALRAGLYYAQLRISK